MQLITVVIPFYQRQPGLLLRAITSVDQQSLPIGWRVKTIVVDDGSPSKAVDEGLAQRLETANSVTVMEQPNLGVGSARNTGLNAITDDSALVAFLDSDDSWPADHLARAIDAFERGYDLYFTDNRREGQHETQCRWPQASETDALIKASGRTAGLLEMPQEAMVGLSISEFPCQASTVVYRRTIAPNLRFNTALQYAGEDVLFFTELLASAPRIAFDLDSKVECGKGVNIYFSHLSWDSPRFLKIKIDQLIAHRILGRCTYLSEANQIINNRRLRLFESEAGFHLLRNLFLSPGRAALQFYRLWRNDWKAVFAVQAGMVRSAFHKLSGRKPIQASIG